MFKNKCTTVCRIETAAVMIFCMHLHGTVVTLNQPGYVIVDSKMWEHMKEGSVWVGRSYMAADTFHIFSMNTLCTDKFVLFMRNVANILPHTHTAAFFDMRRMHIL